MAGIIAHDGNAEHGPSMVVLPVDLGTGHLESPAGPDREALDDTPLIFERAALWEVQVRLRDTDDHRRLAVAYAVRSTRSVM